MVSRARREREMSLVSRRHELAALYNSQMEEWRQEVMSKVETIEERKARIMEKAYALRDARESARNAYVKDCYDRQWRDACDDARTLDSIATTKFMAKERMNQIHDKIIRNESLNANENSFLDEWKRQLELIESKDRAKSEFRHRSDMETQAGIMAQMAYNRKMKEDHYQRTQAEDEEEIRRIRASIDADNEIQKKRSDDAHRRGREVLEFNSQFKDIAAKEAEIERQQNAILLEYALRKEREQIQFEEDKKTANKNASLQYTRYLKEQMIKDAENNGFVDEINKRESEKVWKARDDALQAREDARNYLMKLVKEGRKEQISYKIANDAREKTSEQIYVKKFIEDAKEGIEKERADATRRRRLAEDNNQRLMQQIDLRRRQEEAEKQEVYLADKTMKHIERQHQQRLATQGGTVKTFYGLQANNWYT